MDQNTTLKLLRISNDLERMRVFAISERNLGKISQSALEGLETYRARILDAIEELTS